MKRLSIIITLFMTILLGSGYADQFIKVNKDSDFNKYIDESFELKTPMQIYERDYYYGDSFYVLDFFSSCGSNWLCGTLPVGTKIKIKTFVRSLFLWTGEYKAVLEIDSITNKYDWPIMIGIGCLQNSNYVNGVIQNHDLQSLFMQTIPYTEKIGIYTNAINNVNLWPIYYSNEDILSILWPIFCKSKKGYASYPVFSFYKDGTYSILPPWTLCYQNFGNKSEGDVKFYYQNIFGSCYYNCGFNLSLSQIVLLKNSPRATEFRFLFKLLFSPSYSDSANWVFSYSEQEFILPLFQFKIPLKDQRGYFYSLSVNDFYNFLGYAFWYKVIYSSSGAIESIVRFKPSEDVVALMFPFSIDNRTNKNLVSVLFPLFYKSGKTVNDKNYGDVYRRKVSAFWPIFNYHVDINTQKQAENRKWSILKYFLDFEKGTKSSSFRLFHKLYAYERMEDKTNHYLFYFKL